MVERFLANMSHMRVTCRATLSAVPFYEQFGFKRVHADLTFTEEVDGDWGFLDDSDDESEDEDGKPIGFINMIREKITDVDLSKG
jgi:hypothetical protein